MPTKRQYFSTLGKLDQIFSSIFMLCLSVLGLTFVEVVGSIDLLRVYGLWQWPTGGVEFTAFTSHLFPCFLLACQVFHRCFVTLPVSTLITRTVGRPIFYMFSGSAATAPPNAMSQKRSAPGARRVGSLRATSASPQRRQEGAR